MLERIREVLERIASILGGPFVTPPIVIPGLTLGGAYAANDAFGTIFTIPVPERGVVHGVIFYDRDNEKLAKELVLSPSEFTATANDAAFAPLAAELSRLFPIRIVVGNYDAYSANAIGHVEGIDFPYVAPHGKLWCQLVTRGADNIAAGSEPLISLIIV